MKYFLLKMLLFKSTLHHCSQREEWKIHQWRPNCSNLRFKIHHQ